MSFFNDFSNWLFICLHAFPLGKKLRMKILAWDCKNIVPIGFRYAVIGERSHLPFVIKYLISLRNS